MKKSGVGGLQKKNYQTEIDVLLVFFFWFDSCGGGWLVGWLDIWQAGWQAGWGPSVDQNQAKN